MDPLWSVAASVFGTIVGAVIGARVAAGFQRHDRYLDSVANGLFGITTNLRDYGEAAIDFVYLRRNNKDGTAAWGKMAAAKNAVFSHLVAIELLLEDDVAGLRNALDEMLTKCSDEAASASFAKTTPQKMSGMLLHYNNGIQKAMKSLFRKLKHSDPLALVEE